MKNAGRAVVSCPAEKSVLPPIEQNKNFTFVLSCRIGHRDDRSVLPCSYLCSRLETCRVRVFDTLTLPYDDF